MSLHQPKIQSSAEALSSLPRVVQSAELAANRLIDSIAKLESCVIAFSGGVDSSVVANAAFVALGDRAVAITGVGNAVSELDLKWADEVTKTIGIRHIRVNTEESQDPNYVRNDKSRCYFCKSHLYKKLSEWAKEHGFRNILSGTNSDDLSDYRPGLEAAKEYSIVAPLADAALGKDMVRAIASHWALPVANRPASPCLASRIAYGQSVSSERLHRIETAEAFLVSKGFYDVRVRLHSDELARIEIHANDFKRIMEPDERQAIHDAFRSMGFQFVTFDLGGRQSGSLNRSLTSIATLRRPLPILQ